MKKLGLLVSIIGLLLVVPSIGSAGNSIGVFCWNLSPNVDVVCFNIETQGTFAYSLVGWDHIHTLSTDVHYPLSGAAVFDSSSGAFRLQWDVRIYDASAPIFRSFAASISSATLNGAWIEDNLAGSTGAMLFTGFGPQ